MGVGGQWARQDRKQNMSWSSQDMWCAWTPCGDFFFLTQENEQIVLEVLQDSQLAK